MPYYDVLVTREASECTTVRVFAKNENEAEEKAFEESLKDNTKWELNKGNFHEPYICDPGNCAEEVKE